MTPSRRRFLAGSAGIGSTALALLAGCLDRADGPGNTPTESPTATGSPTDSPSPTASPTPSQYTPLPDRMVEWPDGPKERPAIPDELTESSVRSFAKTHEFRYVYNSLWYSKHSEVDVTCERPEVERIDVGWRAVVTCSGYSTTQGTPDEDGNTATPMHADWFTQTWAYLIDENSIIRQRPGDDGEGTASPSG